MPTADIKLWYPEVTQITISTYTAGIPEIKLWYPEVTQITISTYTAGIPEFNLVYPTTSTIDLGITASATTINIETNSSRNFQRFVYWQFQESGDVIYAYTILNGDTTGVISGIVKIDDVPVTGAEVALYERVNKTLITKVRTGEGGVFSFNNLLKDTLTNQKYFVVAFDTEGAPLKNAQIYDYLIPT